MNSISFENYLNEYGKLTYKFYGVSMNPMLKQGRDLFTVEAKTKKRCKKYDVVLYRRKDQYVLHRIIEVRPNDYVILGDNCLAKEYGISDDDIIGVLTQFLRKGKTISVNHKGYQLYSRVWLFIYPLRKMIKQVKGKLRSLITRL